MRGLAGRLAILLALSLAAFNGARASEIACPPNYQASTVRCVDASSRYCVRPAARQASGERLICEYAMLNVTYERIYADQQRMLHAGTLSMADLMAWRRKRNACESVGCVDAVFADWRRMAARRPAEHRAPPPRSVATTESKPAVAAPATVAPQPAVNVPLPMPPESPVTPARVESVVPVALTASVAPIHATGHSPPWLLAWLAVPVAILCMLAWTLMHGKGHEMAPVSVRALVDRLHHISHMAFFLGALILINGVLLVMVLAS